MVKEKYGSKFYSEIGKRGAEMLKHEGQKDIEPTKTDKQDDPQGVL
jgi:hypothetical protein